MSHATDEPHGPCDAGRRIVSPVHPGFGQPCPEIGYHALWLTDTGGLYYLCCGHITLMPSEDIEEDHGGLMDDLREIEREVMGG